MSDSSTTPPTPPTLPTTERLAQALEAANDPRLAPLIERARAGYYDDYKSNLPAPIAQLVIDLHALGHHALIQRAIDGEFDGTPAEAEAWAASPEGRAAISSLSPKAPKKKPPKGYGLINGLKQPRH